MDLRKWAPPELDDDKLAATAGVVRAELLRRLERTWSALEPWLEQKEDADGIVIRPDPRLVTAGLTCLRQLHQLYRLDQPRPTVDKAPPATGEILARVMKELGDLEARSRQGDG